MNVLSRIIFTKSNNRVLGTIVFFYFLWMASLVFRSIHGDDDLDVFLNAGKRLMMHEDIYEAPFYNNLRYYYSPLFALLVSPLSTLQPMLAKFIWFSVNFILVIRCVFIIKKHTEWNFKYAGITLFLLCLCSGKLILHNFLTNQLTIFILWTLLESYNLCLKPSSFLAVLVFCIGLNFKVMSLVVLPFFLYLLGKRGWILWSFVFVLLLIIPACFIDWNYNTTLLSHWWGTINPVDKFHVIQVSEPGFLDLGALLSKYLSSQDVVGEPRANIASMGYVSILLITNALRLLILLLVILAVRKVPESVAGIPRSFIQLVPFIALIPLLLPHQRDYSYLLVMPMFTVLLILLGNVGKLSYYIWLVLAVCVSGMPFWASMVGSHIVDIFYDYKLVPLGMAALILLYIDVLTYHRAYESKASMPHVVSQERMAA